MTEISASVAFDWEACTTRPTLFEKALICYARRLPISRGKMRIIRGLWAVAAGKRDARRVARLIHGGFRVQCDLRDMLQRQMFFFGTYYLERDLLAEWGRCARKARTVFDVGANAGIYSLAALAANPTVNVHAFQPTPEIVARLRATAKVNSLTRLYVHEAAVSSRSGQADLIRCRGDDGTNDGMNFIRSLGSVAGAERVTTVRLDEFSARAKIERIDLMKIDVQGCEAAVLSGASGLLARGGIGTIFLELNWSSTPGFCPATDAVALLDRYGYAYRAPLFRGRSRPSGAWMRALTDVIAEPASGLHLI